MRLFCENDNTVVVLPRLRQEGRKFYHKGWHNFEPEDLAFVVRSGQWRRATWKDAGPGDTCLFVRDAGLGDILRLTPALREVAQRGMKIEMAVYPHFADIFDGSPHVSKVRTFKAGSHPQYPETEADFVIDLFFAVDGYDNPATRMVSRIDRFGIKISGHPPADKTMVFNLNPKAQEVADKLLEPLEGKPFIVFSSKSWANNLRSWVGEYYSPAARMLGEHGYECVYVGKPSPDSAEGFLDLRGETQNSCQELAGIVNRATAIVSPDTGTMHLGEVLGRPTLGLFGNTNPQEVIQYYEHTVALSGNELVSCPPCLKHQGSCDKCMRAITPEMVVSAVLDLVA